jgi:cytochrome c biogenesis protein CcdA
MLTDIFALLAGTLTVAAPCTLPVLPILLDPSVAQTSNARPVFIAVGFVTTHAGNIGGFFLGTTLGLAYQGRPPGSAGVAVEV